MSEIKFEIKKRIGIISETSNTSLELNLVSWNNGTPKYDLRNGEVMELNLIKE